MKPCIFLCQFSVFVFHVADYSRSAAVKSREVEMVSLYPHDQINSCGCGKVVNILTVFDKILRH